jgi:ATP-dependent RNA helicase DeaD
LPDDAEVYVHRIGRTGRAGKTGIAITLLSPREKRRLREVEALTKQPIKKMELPSASDIVKHREGQVIETMKIWLGRGRYKRELEMIQELIAAGYDPLNIAAAALKLARADEKQRPIAEITEIKEEHRRKEGRGKRESPGRHERSEKGGGSRRYGDTSHEEGMVRLKLNKGKLHGVRPNDIVGTIAFHANIPGYTIGKIRIEDKMTYVDIPENLVEQVLKQNGNYRIGKEKVSLAKA